MTTSQPHAPDSTLDATLLINGVSVNHAVRLQVHNPARPAEMVGSIVRATAEHVDAAVAAARAAFPAWKQLGYRQRAAILVRGLDRLRYGIDERAVLLVRENGKTLAEAHQELDGLPDRYAPTSALVDELEKTRLLDAPGGRTVVIYQPYGVILSIVPWNAPVTLAFNQITAALLAGNTVVVKPPESAPLALIASIEQFAGALPAGVINVVTGLPGEIGDALTLHPDIDKIGFTGSKYAASGIMANAAKSIKGVNLELGGNDAAIVLDDFVAHRQAMQRMIRSVYGIAGQVCMAIKRIYVPRAMHDSFVAAFAEAAQSIVVGDGMRPGVTMGPLHNVAALARARDLIEDSLRAGGRVQALGQARYDSQSGGYFIQPHLVTGLAHEARLVVEEQFCPVLPILSYHTLDEAFVHANATRFGLGASIWTADVEGALALAARFESGAVFVNAHGTQFVNRSVGYGGIKQSGIGRKSGLEGVREYLQSQTITTFEPPIQ